MSNHDQQGRDFPDNMDEASGRAKQAVGDLTNDQDLKDEGKAQEAAGTAKEMVDNVADKAKGLLDKVTGKDD